MADAPQLLFAYGTLGPRDRSEVGSGGWTADAVRGRLFDLGPYPALIDCGDEAAGWVEGFVRAVDLRELVERLDPYEGVDEGLYRRIFARTREGRAVWIYEYRGRLPDDARGPLRRWRDW